MVARTKCKVFALNAFHRDDYWRDTAETEPSLPRFYGKWNTALIEEDEYEFIDRSLDRWADRKFQHWL